MNNEVLELQSLIEGFRLSCQTEGKSIKTIEWYVTFLNRFRGFLNSQDLSSRIGQISRNDIRAFIRYLQTEAKTPHGGKLLSAATVQGYVRTLKAFFAWLVQEEYIDSNPMIKIPVPRAPVKILNTFSQEQIIKLAILKKKRAKKNFAPLLQAVQVEYMP